jgi:hypothetical protein
VNRKPCAYLICRDWQPIHNAALRRCAKIIWNYRDDHFVLARENFAEPANASCHRE